MPGHTGHWHILLIKLALQSWEGGRTETRRKGRAYQKRVVLSNVSLEVRRSLLKGEEDLDLVLQDEWVQLGSEKGENIPSAKEEGSKSGEVGMVVDSSQDLRR